MAREIVHHDHIAATELGRQDAGVGGSAIQFAALAIELAAIPLLSTWQMARVDSRPGVSVA